MDSARREEDSVEFRAVLRLGGQEVGARRLELLEAISRSGSISKAAAEIGMTYKGAWDAVDALNNLSERPLVQVQHGGRGGGGAALTEFGKRLLAEFERLRRVQEGLPAVSLSEAGKTGVSDAELSEFLALEPGRSAFALIKASWIVLSLPGGPKTSARNQLCGVVEQIHEGAVNSEVVVALPGGRRLAAVVTTESAREMNLEIGRAVCALIKASSVIVGVLP